jgi:hypothetical protein
VVKQLKQLLQDLLLPGYVQQEACMCQLGVVHHKGLRVLFQPRPHLQERSKIW